MVSNVSSLVLFPLSYGNPPVDGINMEKNCCGLKIDKVDHFVFGPTHEEVITDLVSSFVSSYKQLPVLIYQIQTKFRDEIRPRFGLMRGREFLMKDAYSFHDTTDSLDSMYHRARDAYKQIFQRCGLTFIEAAADSGAIGGDESAEFLVVAQSGEDEILVNNELGFAANIEACECLDVDFQHDSAIDEIESVKTPNIKTIADVSTFLKLESNACIKSILIIASDKPYLFCLPGNRELNEAKVMKVLNASFRFASSEEVVKYMGCSAGFIGPVNSKDIPLYFDYSLKELLYYCCGANRDDVHFRNVNLNRDVTHIHWVDIKNAAAGDPCVIDSSKSLSLTRGIEVGHVFKLNDKYSTAMSAKFNDSNGHSLPFQMGCYGIGIGRTIAATIEQSHDDNGIIWPEALSPFHVVIVHLCPDDDPMTAIVTNLVSEIESLGKDVIVDNRNESPGVKFKDADLIGFPYQIVIGRKVISNK